MKQQIRAFIRQRPLLLKLALMVQSGLIFSPALTRKIQGKKNQLLIDPSAFCVNCVVDIIGDNNVIVIEEAARLRRVTFFIRGNNNRIVVSKRVRFNRSGELWIEDDGGGIHIGENTAIEEAHLAVTEPGSSIQIGRDCLLAYDIDLRTGDSHSILDAATGQRLNYARDVVLEDHVWIAAHCSVLKGVRLRKNSVVATRSVLTKSFDQAGIIVGGNPARLLRENITWNEQRIYQDVGLKLGIDAGQLLGDDAFINPHDGPVDDFRRVV